MQKQKEGYGFYKYKYYGLINDGNCSITMQWKEKRIHTKLQATRMNFLEYTLVDFYNKYNV